MQATQVHEHEGLRTFVVVLDTGDELMDCLLRVSRERGISGASFSAIGACERVTLAYFDWDSKEYVEHPVDEQVELASLVGNVATTTDATPRIHMHGVVARSSTEARAGHVLKAWCRPTIEVVIEETPAHLRRVQDDETGLPLIDLDRSETGADRHSAAGSHASSDGSSARG